MVELGWPALTVPEAARRHRARHGRARRSSPRSSAGCIAPGPAARRRSRQFVPAVREARHRRAAGRASSAPVAAGDAAGHARDRRGDRRSFDPAAVDRDRRRPTATALRARRRRSTASSRRDAVDEIVVVARVAGHRRGDDGVARVRRPGRRRRTSTPVAALDASRRLAHRHARRRRASTPTACSATPGPPAAAGAAPRARGGDRRARARDRRHRARRSSTSRSSTPSSASSSACRSARSRRSSTSSPTCSSRSSGPGRLGYFAALTIAEDDDAPHARDVGGQGRGRRLPAPARQGGHPDPRRHRLHVGARHAPLRAPREVERAAVRHRARRTAPASPTCSGCVRSAARSAGR